MEPVLRTITENNGGIFWEELISRGLVVGLLREGPCHVLPPTSTGNPCTSSSSTVCWSPPLCYIPSPWRQRSPALPLKTTQWGKDLGRIAFLSILFLFLPLGFLEDRKRGLLKRRLGWVSSCSDVVGPCLKDLRVRWDSPWSILEPKLVLRPALHMVLLSPATLH